LRRIYNYCTNYGTIYDSADNISGGNDRTAGDARKGDGERFHG